MNSVALTRTSSRRAAEPLWTGLLLSSLLFMPSALGFFFEGTSFAAGTAIVCVVALVLSGAGQISFGLRDAQTALAVTVAVSFVIGIHLLIADIVNNDPAFDVGRAFLSLLLFGLIAMSVPAICEGVMVADGRKGIIVKVLCILFAVIAIFSLLKIQPETTNIGEKPSFPYTEPSFLGFSVGGVLIFTLVRSSVILRVIIISAFFVLGYALSNFTIIAVCVLAALVALPISLLVAGAAVLIAGEASLDLSYYTDRLNFDWASSTNLSSLVYVQGWQMLQEALEKTNGWGVGFQQLGIVYTNVPASIRISFLLGRDANLQDGGFILSKMGSEFGLIGFLLVASYFYIALRSLLKLRRVSYSKLYIADGELFARSCIVGYSIELIVRGTNYFTGTFVLLLASLLYLYKMRHTRVTMSAAA